MAIFAEQQICSRQGPLSPTAFGPSQETCHATLRHPHQPGGTLRTDAITVVVPHYGLSDVGLVEICRRLGIPVPDRGYWAKVKAGRTTRKVRMPALPPESSPKPTVNFLRSGR